MDMPWTSGPRSLMPPGIRTSAAVGLQVAQHFHRVVRGAHDVVGGRLPGGVLAVVLSHRCGADLEVTLSETASQVGARGFEGPPGLADVVDDEDVDLPP